jgi:hypothetical protein
MKKLFVVLALFAPLLTLAQTGKQASLVDYINPLMGTDSFEREHLPCYSLALGYELLDPSNR